MAISLVPTTANLAVAEINYASPNPTNTHSSISPRYHSIKAYGPLLDHVFSLRYESYSTEDYIEKNPTKRFMDEYDSQPNCTSYLTYHDKKLIGSIRLCRYSPGESWKIPVMNIFKEEIKKEIGLKKSFLEANRFVVHPDFQKKGGARARFSIYRNIITEADKAETHCVLAAVREEHVRFYRMVNFAPISDIKSYSGLKFKTILMACFDLDRSREFVLNQTDRRAQTPKNDYLFNDRCS